MSWYRRLSAVMRVDINIVLSSMSFQVTLLLSKPLDEVFSLQGISIVSSVELKFSTGICIVSCIIRS